MNFLRWGELWSCANYAEMLVMLTLVYSTVWCVEFQKRGRPGVGFIWECLLDDDFDGNTRGKGFCQRRAGKFKRRVVPDWWRLLARRCWILMAMVKRGCTGPSQTNHSPFSRLCANSKFQEVSDETKEKLIISLLNCCWPRFFFLLLSSWPFWTSLLVPCKPQLCGTSVLCVELDFS